MSSNKYVASTIYQQSERASRRGLERILTSLELDLPHQQNVAHETKVIFRDVLQPTCPNSRHINSFWMLFRWWKDRRIPFRPNLVLCQLGSGCFRRIWYCVVPSTVLYYMPLWLAALQKFIRRRSTELQSSQSWDCTLKSIYTVLCTGACCPGHDQIPQLGSLIYSIENRLVCRWSMNEMPSFLAMDDFAMIILVIPEQDEE